jgi:hypothetical protein
MVNVYTLYVHNSVPSAGGLAEQLQSTGSIKMGHSGDFGNERHLVT